MNQEDYRLVCETIELLRDFRVKAQADVENSVVHQLDQLDEAIAKLEEASRTRPGQIAKQEVLELLGEAIKWLPPVVAKLIELLLE